MSTAITTRRLTRSTSRRMFSGVCGGIARYSGINRWLIRAIWLGSFLFFGAGLVLYVAAAFVIPEDRETARKPDVEPQGRLRRSNTDRLMAGVCAGLAGRFQMDPSLVRILWILATIGSAGLGILAYVGLYLMMPPAHRTQAPLTSPQNLLGA